MSTITAIADENIQPINGGFQAMTKPSLSLALGAIGDVAVLQFKMREQVEALSGASISVSNVTGTRSYSAEFRWGIDGAAWSSWLAFTSPMLAAQVLDIDEQFYIEIRITRTGSDATGVLLWTFAGYTATTNDQGTVGRGLISQENLHGDTIALFVALIQSWVWQYGGADHYEVVYAPRSWKFSTVKPTIYVHSLTQGGYSRESISEYGKNAQISIGVKPVVGKTDGYNQQLSRLLAMFDPLNAGAVRWTFDFKGVHYIDATLGDVGVSVNSTSGMQEFQDHDTYTVYHEFVLSFSVSFTNIAKY